MADNNDPLIGKKFGSFTIKSMIGKGGMARVYRAYQESMDRDVAIKVLPLSLAEDPQFVGRFKQEARVIAQLEHNNILPVYDFGEADGHLFIAMRMVETGTLADLMKGKMPMQQVNKLIGQVGDALDYAHSRGIIHRDIKPTNVLITQRGNALLTDFGIAKLSQGNDQGYTQTGSIIGTPTYMSPEQGMGQKLDGRSDIYSLGVMLYHMAVGQAPYKADTPMAVLMKHVQETPPNPRALNPDLSPAVEAVILKSLAKRPDDRFTTAGDMTEALNEAVNRGTTSWMPGAAAPATQIDEAPWGTVPSSATQVKAPTGGIPAPVMRSQASAQPSALPPQTGTGPRSAAPAQKSGGGLGGILGGGLIGIGAVIGGILLLGACGLGFWAMSGGFGGETPATEVVVVPSATPPAAQPSNTPVVAGPSSTPSFTPSSTPVSGGGSGATRVLYEDDFSDPTTGWDVGTDDDSALSYLNGEYVMQVKSANLVIWANPDYPEPLSNVSISVTARDLSSTNDGGFGVLCYYGNDGNDFYYFEVGSDTYYRIVRVEDRQQSEIIAGDEYSSLIPEQADTYELEVVCQPGRQTLYVNGRQVAEANDNRLVPGDIGLLASTYDNPGVRIHFDDLVVAQVGGATDIAGSYSVDGVNPDGTTYQGTARLVRQGNTNNYVVTWTIGEQVLTAQGELVGNIFTIEDGSSLSVYTVYPDGTLDGTWTLEGETGVGTETMTPTN